MLEHLTTLMLNGAPTMIFIDNKYTRTYKAIIIQAKDRVNCCYTEKHHIIPKSLGGSNRKDNIAVLTAREHFICHRLLVKMTTGINKVKMQRAAWAMTVHTSKRTANRHRISGSVYEQIRKEYINTIKGKPKTAEHRAKLGQYTRTEEHRKFISDMRKNQIGKHTHSEETKKRMSLWQQGVPKPKITCEHCGKESNLMNYKKWHGDNCKLVKERTIPKVTCEHCNKSVDYANYSQWHGDKCKHRS